MLLPLQIQLNLRGAAQAITDAGGIASTAVVGEPIVTGPITVSDGIGPSSVVGIPVVSNGVSPFPSVLGRWFEELEG